MEFSERAELEKLIAFSKSFKVKDPLAQDLLENDSPRNQMYDQDAFSDISQMLMEIENTQSTCETDLQQQLRDFLVSNQLMDEIPLEKKKSEVVKPEQQNQSELIANQVQDEVKQDEQQQLATRAFKSYSKINNEELLMESYFEKVKGRKSLFTQKIKTKQTNNSSIVTQVNAGNSKQIKIFFFNSARNVKIRILKNTTVSELLKLAIEAYLSDSQLDAQQIKYPQYATEAYEIRILDDDDGYRPDMSFPALDKSRIIMQTQFDQFALIETPSFKPPQATKDQSIINTLEKISKDKNTYIVSVEIKDDNMEDNWTTTIQMDRNQTIKDVFDHLYKKNKKYNTKNYIARVKFQNEEDYIDIDLSMPITQLQTKTIMVFAFFKSLFLSYLKKFGLIKQYNRINKQSQRFFGKPIIKEDDEEDEAPLNTIQAFKYEEFSVIKINEQGKRQQRVLGINQFRIFNQNKKPPNNLNFINKLFTNSITGTKYPERLIEDIVSIKVEGVILLIKFKQESGQEKFKELKFETIDTKIAKKIEKKLNFIREFSNQSFKQRGLSQRFE